MNTSPIVSVGRLAQDGEEAKKKGDGDGEESIHWLGGYLILGRINGYLMDGFDGWI